MTAGPHQRVRLSGLDVPRPQWFAAGAKNRSELTEDRPKTHQAVPIATLRQRDAGPQADESEVP